MGGLDFGWPQLTWLTLFMLTAGIYMARHGKPREDFYNLWYFLVGSAINIWILYAGGFFS